MREKERERKREGRDRERKRESTTVRTNPQIQLHWVLTAANLKNTVADGEAVVDRPQDH